MKRILSVICCCLCLLHCSTKKDSQQEQVQKVFKPGAFFIAVENARKSKPPDIPAIDSVYSSHLAPFIKKVDLGSDVVITEAISKAEKNEAPHVQSQIISKTIQKVFFNEIGTSLKSLKNECAFIIFNS